MLTTGIHEKINNGTIQSRKYFIFLSSFHSTDGVSLIICCKDRLGGAWPVSFFSTASAKGPLKGYARKLAMIEKLKKTMMLTKTVKIGMISHITALSNQSGSQVGIKLFSQLSN